MAIVTEGRPLSDEEYEVLDEFLASCEDGQAMSLEEIDGFFCALVVGPGLVPPSEFLPEVFGGEIPKFQDMEEAKRITGLLMRHWNGVADAFAKGEVYVPYLLEDGDGTATANEWAQGFLVGISMRNDAWAPLRDDEEACVALIPMMAFAFEHDPDPELRPDSPIAPESRTELIGLMTLGAKAIYEYFRAARAADVDNYVDTSRYVAQRGPKVGRNDPCPCGSGKKYKRCCGR